MDFDKIRIPYEGRREFGREGGDGRVIANSIISQYFGGGGTGGSETGGNGQGYGGDENRGGNATSFYAYLSKTSRTYSGPATDTIFVYGFKDMEQAQTLIGDITKSASTIVNLDDTWDISGNTEGFTIVVEGNGTTATTISVTVTGTPQNSGTLIFPVNVNINDNPLDPYHYTWWQNQNKVKSVNLNFSWSIDLSASGTTGLDGKSAWYMTLSNDNASINCDSEGNILSGAVRPAPCKVKIFYGDEQRVDSTYVVSSNTPYTGITTGTSNDGVLTITCSDGTMNWEGSLLQLTISGSSSGEVRDIKTMNISKVIGGKAGEDGTSGAPATSYWLAPSFTEIIYDVNNHSANPRTITCEKWMQVGQDEPKSGSDVTAKIYYTFQSRGLGVWDVEREYTSAIDITSGICENSRRLRFILKSGQTQYDLEDVDIIKDGKDGEDGSVGRAGAAIRGPYNYYDYSASTQCWCAGSGGTTPCEDCDKWIDVILKDDTYYYCNHTYTQTIDYGMDSSRNWWTSGASFDFIATKLLLAENAKIDFLTGNELYLRDSEGRITGGARGGSGITFWAGSENPLDTNVNTPFWVDTAGNLHAEKGIFAGYVQMPYINMDRLSADTNGYFIADDRAYLIASKYMHHDTLRLPTPSSGLNGFTYHIVIYPDFETRVPTRGAEQVPILTMVSHNLGEEIYVAAFASDSDVSATLWKKVELYAGHVEMTCMPYPRVINGDVVATYVWVITTCTSGICLYDNENLNSIKGAYSPLMGYSPTSNFNVPIKLQTDNNPVGRARNTIYITL